MHGYNKENYIIENKFNAIGIDSLDYLNILLEIECKYGISFLDGDAEKLNTPAKLINYVQSKIYED